MSHEHKPVQPTTRQTIAEEATRLFRRKGYRATSLEDVAAEFGISRPALYYHFKSKRDILYTIYRGVSDILIKGASEIYAMDLPPGEKFRRLVRNHASTILNNADRMAVYYDEEAELGEAERADVRNTRRRYTQMLIEVYRQAVESGHCVDLPPKMAVNIIIGACNWAYKWYDPAGAATPEEVTNIVERLLMDGYVSRVMKESEAEKEV